MGIAFTSSPSIVAEANAFEQEDIPLIHYQLQFWNESRSCAVAIQKVINNIEGYPSPVLPIIFALDEYQFARLRSDFLDAEKTSTSSIVVSFDSDDLEELGQDNPIYTHQEQIDCDRWWYSITFNNRK
jgi:hypothetical protein